MNLSKLKRKYRKGLTLIELAVVVIILGALIALVYSNFRPGEISDDTAALKLKKDAYELQSHLERYAQRYGTYPSDEQGLEALVEKPTTGDVPEDWKPILTKKTAINDPWGTAYKLKRDVNGEIQIVTMGKDKKDGGESKNADFNILNEDEYPSDFRRK
ncbi:type II secretion system major pseudopilin GspG [Leptospira noguchii]|uniref:Type II secretion system protein G n=4 Tax=Leptospira noguchii TaxID=28182 RepID=M6Y6I9_9LEPT|nr:type II secretion system major pseudopilin GspG [Leptospira noguchii]EMO28009.1 type II secretion system protein G [Leptospira interrogans serovar Bataviae str. HAI135]EKR72744.1 type II secretion system protein G [Leptospira noguchii str. 2006001870]EMN00130.1 type II secretion system protein G [Leptospira noguchii str. 2007001578]EMO42109.1 type II secretion system protein G [Leptospira noguchii serovar Autumnalis str. ZUN142]EMO89947.1 type II secretion system protein G [Leptospira noguc